jgi:hypothetical protein
MRSGTHVSSMIYVALGTEDRVKKSYMAKKDPAAVSLGRRGGQARAKKLTAEERTASARKAAQTRWAKKTRKTN